MKLILLPLLTFTLSAFALDVEQMGQILSGEIPLAPGTDCYDPVNTPRCGQITAAYCRQLAFTGGHASDGSGEVNIGKSEKSQISQIEREGLDDLVRSLPSLPEDLKRALQKPVADLAALLTREADEKKWYRDVSKVRGKIADKIEDVARRRADAALRSRFSGGRRPTREDRDAERDLQERQLREIVTRARMESSPKWGRLTEIFAHVKRDMVDVVNSLPLTPEEKAKRLERIARTDLSFPFGIRMGGKIGEIIDDDCTHNMVNAFYMPFTGTLTVCAGLVNGYQSENALYFTLAHELAHSFNQFQLQSAEASPRSGPLSERLMSSNGNIPCQEYQTLKTRVTSRAPSFPCGSEKYTNFITCLNETRVSDPNLLVNSETAGIGQVLSGLKVCDIADQRQGEAYMNPNLYADRNFATLTEGSQQEFTGAPVPGARNTMVPVYRLTQELRCQQGTPNCPEALGTVAVEMLNEIDTPPACLGNASVAAENESDWYAHKAMLAKLQRDSNIRTRREMVASSMGLFCGAGYRRPLTEKQEEELMHEIDKIAEDLASDTHADNDHRIDSIMTEEMGQLLQCVREDEPNYQSCKL